MKQQGIGNKLIPIIIFTACIAVLIWRIEIAPKIAQREVITITDDAEPLPLPAEEEMVSVEEKEDEAQNDVADETISQPASFYNEQGETLRKRIRTPEGYVRTDEDAGSFAEYLRDYPLKPYGSEVLLYDGTPKAQQNLHAAVFTLPMVSGDLQQCADAVMRMYAEYLYASGMYDKIKFHLTDGSLCAFTSYTSDHSYTSFENYFRYICAYAGTLSMEGEVTKITMDDLKIGDVFLKGGSPGHACMVADLCEKDGNKAFLLAESYMPAQEFHVIRNILHSDDPWYYEEEIVYPFQTTSYLFPEGSLKRPIYLQQ